MPTPNTATFLERLLTFFQTAASISFDNSETDLDATTVQEAIVEIATGGSLPSIAAQTILGNATTGSTTATATAPQAFIFKDATSGAGNIRGQVAPQGYGAITSLADDANVNVDIALTENGTYDFSVIVRAKMTSTRISSAYKVFANRVSETLALEGDAVPMGLGTSTGLTVTISATSGSLRVNVLNETGETINGRVHVGWFVEDLI